MSLEDEGEEVEGDFAPGDANGENSGDPFTPSATEEENSEVHRFNLYETSHFERPPFSDMYCSQNK